MTDHVAAIHSLIRGIACRHTYQLTQDELRNVKTHVAAIAADAELAKDHANALAAERDALLKQVEQLTDLLRMAGQLYNIPDHALEAMIEKALDVT